MRDLALSLAGGVATGLVGAAVILWVFVRVWREETAQENTATEEMRARTLEFYKAHLNDECRAGLLAEIPDTGIRKPSRGSI